MDDASRKASRSAEYTKRSRVDSEDREFNARDAAMTEQARRESEQVQKEKDEMEDDERGRAESLKLLKQYRKDPASVNIGRIGYVNYPYTQPMKKEERASVQAARKTSRAKLVSDHGSSPHTNMLSEGYESDRDVRADMMWLEHEGRPAPYGHMVLLERDPENEYSQYFDPELEDEDEEQEDERPKVQAETQPARKKSSAEVMAELAKQAAVAGATQRERK